MTAIERITGFACEVNEDQWRDLVKVADEVGVKVDEPSRINGTEDGRYKIATVSEEDLMTYDRVESDETLIPYPDFLAKLKGVEKWEPKNGEEVEVQYVDKNWHNARFIGMSEGFYVCQMKGDFLAFEPILIRPLRPTITRKEAEDKLNVRIID